MFKQCPNCKYKWPDPESFIKDPAIVIIGYQSNFESPLHGVFIFNHLIKNCQTSLSIETLKFQAIYEETQGHILMGKHKNCPEYCKDLDNIILCPNTDCLGAHIRLIMDKLKKKILPRNFL